MSKGMRKKKKEETSRNAKFDVIEELFVKYYNESLLYIISLCHNKTIAEDMVANAFFKALTSAQEDIQNFKPWLLTVCRNEYISFCRKQKRLSYIELNEEIVEESEHFVECIIKNESYQALYRAISLLPNDQEEVILLFYFSDVPIKSIAGIIGKSEVNTKVLLHRARKALKEILEV